MFFVSGISVGFQCPLAKNLTLIKGDKHNAADDIDYENTPIQYRNFHL